MDPGSQLRWVAPGDVGLVIRARGDRCQVRFADGQQCWIPEDELEKISDAGRPIDLPEILAEGNLGDALAYALRV